MVRNGRTSVTLPMLITYPARNNVISKVLFRSLIFSSVIGTLVTFAHNPSVPHLDRSGLGLLLWASNG